MNLHAALAATATLIAAAFALSTFDRWQDRRARYHLAWTVSLLLFAAGSAALWWGAGVGWGDVSFRAFYLCGAILTVPFLALGTVYLLAGTVVGDRVGAGVALFSAFATGVLVAAPLEGTVAGPELPQGSEVFGPAPRILAAVASGLPALVIFGGAVWSIVGLLRARRDGGGARRGPLPPGRLALANVAIAVGTVVLSLGGLLNSTVGEMNAFAISLVAGISLIFGGFLLTNTPRPEPADPPWLRALLEEVDAEDPELSRLSGPRQN